MLTSEQLKEIRERTEKNITITFKDYDTANEAEKRNRKHITAARNLISTDIPSLLAHIEEVEKERDEAVAKVKGLEVVHSTIREALPGPMYVDQLLNAVMASRPAEAKSVIKAYFADITKIVDEAKT
jgi:hypothetical protein